MKIKKIIAGLTAMMMAGSLAACSAPDVGAPDVSGGGNVTNNGGDAVGGGAGDGAGDGGSESYTSDVDFNELYGIDGPIQLTVYSQLANYSGKSVGWFAEVMKREFNVELTIIPETDGTFDTRMESGNLGDICIFGSNSGPYEQAATKGALFDWNEDDVLSDYGPYIKAHMSHALDSNARLNEEKGAGNVVYGIGHNVAEDTNDHEAFMYTMDIRWDLYKELGYPEIKNLDDLFDLFIDMKEICPTDENGNEVYALSLWPDWDGDMVMYVKSFATCLWGYDEHAHGLYDPRTGEYFFATDENGPYLRSLAFFNKCYRAGLVDPNSMTQTYDKMSEKMTSGGVLFSIFDYAGSQLYNNEDHLSQGKGMYTVFPADATPLCYGFNVLGGNRVWTIGANTEYPELCMAILNYLCTPEGYMTYWYGPKDVCWYYDDEGYSHFTELGESAFKDRKGTTMPDEWGGGSFNDGTFQANNTTWTKDAPNPDSNGETYNAEYWESRQTATDYEILQDWRDFTGARNVQQYLDSKPHVVAPGTDYSPEKQDKELETLANQIKDCVKTYTWRAIYATSDDEYNQIVSEMIAKVNEYDPDGRCKAYAVNEAARRRALEEALG